MRSKRVKGVRGLPLVAGHNLENACTIIMMRNTALAESIRHLYFFYLSGIFYLYYFLINITRKFKEFLRQRTIHNKCHKSIFYLKR